MIIRIKVTQVAGQIHVSGGGPWIMICLEMKREQLARRLARESGITPAAAADQLDCILNDILKRVRHGQSASLPGLGTFWPGPKPEFYFDQGLPPGAQPIRARKRSK
jgi:hypothetical protein